ncbi:hypothetical protein SAMN05216251_105114 [Actinacidiphila alni]|uniref:Guanylate cyclase domain-containing protein n=1 Tax=Actinacidiphila alni TaxID=380248 RepID=A0A1I2D8J5_9ACTN|nr:hypothetical protein [Actinacidiphila alni]SFE76423.1 hypothetical protein SAMN05216251_105114 [Actinacidiphila alni]
MDGESDYGFIINVDAQGSGALRDPDRPAFRARIYHVVETAFSRSGISDARVFQEDRGDGILAVVEPFRTERIAGEWVEHLHQELRKVNRDLARPIRLRAGLNIGPYTPDAKGFSGAAVDLANRIGNCAEAKAVLAAADGAPLLVVVSDRLYQDVIRHGGRWIEPDHYRQFEVSLQEGPQRPWFLVPGRTAPPLPGRGDGTALQGEDAGPSPTEEEGGGERRSPSGGGACEEAPSGGFAFGPVTHSGSGSVFQGHIHGVTIDHRQGGRS